RVLPCQSAQEHSRKKIRPQASAADRIEVPETVKSRKNPEQQIPKIHRHPPALSRQPPDGQTVIDPHKHRAMKKRPGKRGQLMAHILAHFSGTAAPEAPCPSDFFFPSRNRSDCRSALLHRPPPPPDRAGSHAAPFRGWSACLPLSPAGS